MQSKFAVKYLAAFLMLAITVQLVAGCLNENGAKQRIRAYVTRWPTIAQDTTIRALFSTTQTQTQTTTNPTGTQSATGTGTQTATGTGTGTGSETQTTTA